MRLTNPLYLFIHLPKSAGTSLNKHVDKHFTSSQRITISPELLGVERDQLKKILFETKQYLKTLPTSKKKKLKYITGHHLSNGIHKQIDQNKSPYYFTFLRDPAERVVSLYNYYSQWYEQDLDQNKKNNQLYQQILLINGKKPSFSNWYQHKYRLSKDKLPVSSSVAFYRHLGYLSSGRVTNKTAQACLSKFHFVGLTKYFTDDSAFIYHQLGVNKFFINQNISKKYFKLDKHPRILEKLKKDLVSEYQLYDVAVKHRQEFIIKHPEYKQIVSYMKKKQCLVKPFTQIFYDWPDNFRIISKNLRQYLPGYGLLLDQVRGL